MLTLCGPVSLQMFTLASKPQKGSKRPEVKNIDALALIIIVQYVYVLANKILLKSKSKFKKKNLHIEQTFNHMKLVKLLRHVKDAFRELPVSTLLC